jgi:restriction system protein
VQCKQWKARQVGVAIVRELYGVIAARGAAGGYVITSGVFTDEARRFADGREIGLIAGDQLAKVIAEQSVGSARSVAPQANRITAPGEREPPASSSKVPVCPQCGSIMVRRTARKGAQAGSTFWGCPQFPKCRGTRPA